MLQEGKRWRREKGESGTGEVQSAITSRSRARSAWCTEEHKLLVDVVFVVVLFPEWICPETFADGVIGSFPHGVRESVLATRC